MGKASSAKKVARVARAGGGRRSGHRRPLGFPLTVVAVLVMGTSLVVFARNERNANAHPKVASDHWHEAYSIYTCVTEASTPASSTTTSAPATTTRVASDGSTTTSTTSTTTTTAPTTTTAQTTPTTIAGPGDVPGQFQPHPTDATSDVLGIHTHGDGVIHIHPFADSAAGRRATLSKFLDQVGASITDTTLTLPTPTGGKLEFKEGVTKCQGGKDGEVQVARWDSVKAASNGDKPNEIITSNMGSILLKNGQALTISFMPAGSKIPIEKDVEQRLGKLTDLAPPTTTGAPASPTSASASTASTTSPGSSSSSSP